MTCDADAEKNATQHAMKKTKKQNKKRSNKAQKGNIKTKKIYRYLLNKTKNIHIQPIFIAKKETGRSNDSWLLPVEGSIKPNKQTKKQLKTSCFSDNTNLK